MHILACLSVFLSRTGACLRCIKPYTSLPRFLLVWQRFLSLLMLLFVLHVRYPSNSVDTGATVSMLLYFSCQKAS